MKDKTKKEKQKQNGNYSDFKTEVIFFFSSGLFFISSAALFKLGHPTLSIFDFVCAVAAMVIALKYKKKADADGRNSTKNSAKPNAKPSEQLPASTGSKGISKKDLKKL